MLVEVFENFGHWRQIEPMTLIQERRPMHKIMKERSLRLLEWYSSLFPRNLEVTFPDEEPDTIHTVGTGFGGISRLFFERGRGCELDCMGKCCTKSLAGWWFYLPGEQSDPREVLRQETLLINGASIPIWTHDNPKPELEGCGHMDESGRCELYTPERGQPAIVCKYPPHITVRPPKNGRPVWTKRLPPRNWAWPKCPCPAENFQPDIDDDMTLMATLVNGLQDIPGWDPRMSYLPDILPRLYGKTGEKIFYELSAGSQIVWFEDLLSWGVEGVPC